MSARRDAFLARAKERLAPLTGDAYTAELAKINAEVDADVAEAVAEEKRQLQAQLEAAARRYAKVRREAEAVAVIMPLAHDADCATALLPHAVNRIAIEPQGDNPDEWPTVYKDAAGNATTREALQAELAANPSLARLIKGASAEEKARHQERVKLALGEKPAQTNGKAKH